MCIRDSSGTIAKIFSISTPYLGTELAELKYTQSADVMTLTHPNHPTMELSRTAHTSWTLAVATFAPTAARPVSVTASPTVGAASYKYKVTQVLENTLEESLPAYDTHVGIASGAPTDPILITTLTPHGYTTGDEVYISDITSGTLPINNKTFEIIVTGPSAFTLNLSLIHI